MTHFEPHVFNKVHKTEIHCSKISHINTVSENNLTSFFVTIYTILSLYHNWVVVQARQRPRLVHGGRLYLRGSSDGDDWTARAVPGQEMCCSEEIRRKERWWDTDTKMSAHESLQQDDGGGAWQVTVWSFYHKNNEITNLLKVFLTMLAAQLCWVITLLQIVTSQQLSDEILCPKNESYWLWWWWDLHLWVNNLNNYWIDCHEIWSRHSCPPSGEIVAVKETPEKEEACIRKARTTLTHESPTLE